MKTRGIVVLVIAAAAIAAIAVSRRPVLVPDTGRAAAGSDATAATAPANAPNPRGSAPPEPRATEPAWRAPSSPSPRYAEPEEIETQLGQFFAEMSGLEVVSLPSIACGATACEIALTGTEVNPRYVDAYYDLYDKLTGAAWPDFRIRSSSLGTREIAPSAREYVIGFEYQPLVSLSADPLIAARQYAACAAAWLRATQYPAPDDVVRSYLDQAERNIALAASVLGEEEARRVATETRGGPVIRDCF